MNSWHSYPSIYNLGHRYLADLFLDPVLVEEKVDGSQFSFGRFVNTDGTSYLRCRSKGAELNLIAPEKMFSKAIETIQGLFPILKEGWTYRAEYLAKPKHNSLAYDRIPKNHLMIFDINTAEETYLSYEEKKTECDRLGLEVVPIIFEGVVENVDMFRDLLTKESILGGQKLEGVVVKNYLKFGQDKKALMGKFVSEHFREVHKHEWKKSNPSSGDVIQTIIAAYKSPARWAKAVQHLTEQGKLENTPVDIGFLMKEVPVDVEKECADEIKTLLYQWAWPKIRRGIIGGLPEWYKERLLENQFK